MNDPAISGPSAEAGGSTLPAREPEDPPSTIAAHGAPSNSLFQRLSGLFRPRNGSSLRDDLTDALLESAGEGEGFSAGERTMLHNILRLREVRVEDVMIPRADIEAAEMTLSLGALLTMLEQSGRSRVPVYGDTLDDPRGMVHIRDVLGHITRTAAQKKARNGRKVAVSQLDLTNVDLTRTIEELGLVRPVLFVPPSMSASDLMTRMQAQRIQIALVIDEYGGTDGLVSLEDLVEIVVGDIEDEHDDEDALIVQASDGSYVVDGKAEIDDVAEALGGDFVAGAHGEDVDTIGGLIFNSLGRVPVRGEVLQPMENFEFHVLDADPRRVKRVRIVPSRAAERRRRVRPAGAEAAPQPQHDRLPTE